jgi:hypothetical protein
VFKAEGSRALIVAVSRLENNMKRHWGLKVWNANILKLEEGGLMLLKHRKPATQITLLHCPIALLSIHHPMLRTLWLRFAYEAKDLGLRE